jgi:hypothetical protein
MLSSGHLNGDFFTHDVNVFWLTISYVISIIPYYILWKFLSIKKQSNNISITEIKHFDKIVIVLFLFNIFLALVYKVGLYAQNQIYEVPFYIKPFVVIINKLDMYILSGILLMSTRFSNLVKFITISLLMFFSISRGSVFVFLFIFLVFIANGQIKFRIRQILIFFVALTLIFNFIPKLFEYRDGLRNANSTSSTELLDNEKVNDFIKSRILGRISSLSSITYFYQNNDNIYRTQDQVGSFEYVIEFFRPFYGGVYVENKIGYTYYFTNFYDDTAGIDYGVMYGLPSVIMLAYFKGVYVLFVNVIFMLFVIYQIVNLSSYLFGKNYREFSFVLLFYPMMSGVPSEFGQILLYMLFISFLKLLYISFLKSRSKCLTTSE